MKQGRNTDSSDSPPAKSKSRLYAILRDVWAPKRILSAFCVHSCNGSVPCLNCDKEYDNKALYDTFLPSQEDCAAETKFRNFHTKKARKNSRRVKGNKFIAKAGGIIWLKYIKRD